MNIFGFEITRKNNQSGIDINTVIRRLEALYELASGISINPEMAMQSPTVQAIVQAVSRRISTLPVQVLRKTVTSNGRTIKEVLPDHPVARLLRRPNDRQSSVEYWLDATSVLVRYGNFYAFKARGQTGPIRRLEPLHPSAVTVEQRDDLSIIYRVKLTNGQQVEYTPTQIHHVRGVSRDFVTGSSPVMDVAESIALEIAAEKFGAAFFGNGAMPGLIFKYAPGSQGFKSDEEVKRFTEDVQKVFAKKGRFKSLLIPKGIELADPLTVDNEKTQFLATRQYQRTVIAGAFGVPPHMVGDLSKGTFNNVEQQSLAFVMNVVQPYCRIFEAAMERDLLTDADRASGVIIRFNLDAALRADYKTRQEGLNLMRQAGVISANEWREMEGLNPISEEDGGDEYWRRGPSGQSADPPSNAPDPNNTDDESDTNEDEDESDED